MQFLSPGSLWWLLLGIVVLALYLFRRRSKKVKVSTLVFFKTLAREHQESAWLRRLKKWISFLITLLILAVAVFILSRLIVKQDDADQYRTVVILLDRSASMDVRDERGETRLDAAKRSLRDRLKRVPEEVGVSLIAYDIRPEVIQPRTTKRRELLSRLDAVETRPVAGRIDAAVEMAGMIAGLEPPSTIWHLSDRSLEEATATAIGEGGIPSEEVKEDAAETATSVRELNLALPEATNVGITAMQIRAVPLEYSRYDAYVQVALNAGSKVPATVRLNVSVGGIPSQYREITLEPGHRVGVDFRINGLRDEVLRVWIETEKDNFPLDDQISLALPD